MVAVTTEIYTHGDSTRFARGRTRHVPLVAWATCGGQLNGLTLDSVSKRHAVDALDTFLGDLPPFQSEASNAGA